MTSHINAADSAFAKVVLMPGDPLRAKFVAENFLENAKLVTDVRGILGYTGTYKGNPVSVMASGMGMPSIGIYSWELFTQYGVETIIRVGSAGSYADRLKVMDVVLAESAYTDSTYAWCLDGNSVNTNYPSEIVNDAVKSKAVELGVECKMCKVHSSDVFYTIGETWQEIAQRTGTECVEMESFALFQNAKTLGKKAACILTISDFLKTEQRLTAEERQNSFSTMLRLALETAIEL